MKPTNNVVIIILNWKGWEDTIECLESVYQIKYPNFKVIVVDNNSQDNSEKFWDCCSGKLKVESEFLKITREQTLKFENMGKMKILQRLTILI